MATKITREIAAKVLETVDAGLCKGMGEPVPGQMCVEAAVCYALGLPHGDEPDCVSPAIRSLKINLNDKQWSSNEARARGMRRLALAQLGSAGVVDDRELAKRVSEMAIRKMVPIALRAAASIQKNPERKQALLDAANRCEREGTRESALAARTSAAAAADAAASYAASYASASASAASYASASASAAADAAAAAADAAAADAADAAAKRDAVLGAFAEAVVQVLIEMKAPGCRWLDLAPLAEAA